MSAHVPQFKLYFIKSLTEEREREMEKKREEVKADRTE